MNNPERPEIALGQENVDKENYSYTGLYDHRMIKDDQTSKFEQLNYEVWLELCPQSWSSQMSSLKRWGTKDLWQIQGFNPQI